ncbi:MAG: oligoendopeptidase, partial [Deltaproteobacteria bacterium]|nr:oligoendopeptidase [Deltaproteobacteria bacterium]
MSSIGNSASGICWDLSELFASHEDPHIEATLQDCRARAEAFAARFRASIHRPQGPDPATLLDGTRDLEAIEEALSRVASFASLLYAADSLKPEYQDLEQKVERRVTEVRNLLLFFELEWLDVADDVAERLMRDPMLQPYAHYLRSVRRFRPHKLTELEEKIVNEKDNTGRSAFGRLFSEITSALTFSVERDGKPGELTLSETLALMHHPDRQLRQRAWESLFEGLSRHEHALGFIYDTIIQDHLTMDRLRRYAGPMMERHLANEIDGEAVARMMEVSEANYRIGQDYFRLKARLLGLPRLALYDQYAPVDEERASFSFSQAREVVLEALGAFSPIFRSIAAEFFAKRWIDAEIRKGKQGGAFCASPSPQLHPYILCNY